MPHTIVIGAGPGVGLAVARRFGAGGHRVTLMARRVDPLADAVAALAGDGVDASAAPADAGDHVALETAVATAAAGRGIPDVIVYNAATIEARPATAVPAADLDAMLRVGCTGVLAALAAVLPEWRESASGTLLVTGGGWALEPDWRWAGVGVQKAAVRNLVHSLAAELAPSGIHVATVTVLPFLTPGGPHDPSDVAEIHWELATEPPGSWSVERTYPAA